MFSFKEMELKMLFVKHEPFLSGLNPLNVTITFYIKASKHSTCLRAVKLLPFKCHYWGDSARDGFNWFAGYFSNPEWGHFLSSNNSGFYRSIFILYCICHLNHKHICQVLLWYPVTSHEVRIKWSTLCRWHFKIPFLEWILLYFESTFTEHMFPQIQQTTICHHWFW